ncbi:MAG: peptidase domain-containing ABC transporter [Robiginitomaculum sp.]
MFGRKTLPIIHQSEATECGLAALLMVANYHGHDLDLNAVRQRYSVSLKGASLKSIMGMAQNFGLGPRALRLDMEHLHKLQLPAILHWDMNHFVVLKKVGPKRVTIHDPGRGALTMSRAEFSNHFTGIALELTPTADFSAQSNRMRAHLSQLWTKLVGLKRAILQTLILSIILQAAVLAAPFYLQFTVDGVISAGGNHPLLLALALGFGGLAIIRACAEGLRGWAILVYGNQMSFQMVANVFSHLIRLPVAYFEKRHIGDIISRMGSTTPIQVALTQSVVAIFLDGVMAAITIIVMFMFSPLLAAIVAGLTVILAIITILIYPKMRATQEEAILNKALENTHVIESIRASTTVKLLGREASREASWRNLYADFINASTAYGKWVVLQQFAQTLLTGVQAIAVIYFGSLAVTSGAMSLGMLFAFLAFALSFTTAASALLQKGIELSLLGLHLQRLSDIIYAPQEGESAGKPLGDLKGEIRLQNISFRYSQEDPLILEGVNETIAAGEMVAITGKSGGGKTTLLKLILGLYAPTSGEVLIDGEPLSAINLRDWRSQIGVVMQDDSLLSGSLADNISFFDPDLDMAKIVRAAKIARIHDEISAMPMHYMSMVGNMGSVLSGGQKQRVLLARALYNSPKLLFLDEGTANLDVMTEKEIAAVIADMPITRIIIAHRPEFLNRADRVINMG